VKSWLNPDGSINVVAIQAIEDALLATTDQVGKLMDIVKQKGFVPAFVCNHSGLFLPGDLIKNWGRNYGIGLGSSPCSPVLDSDYEADPPTITPDIRSITQIMHPINPCMAQVDRVMVHPSQLEEQMAIMELDDPDLVKRAKIIYQKQIENPRGKLAILRAAWAQKGRV
jgi:hypothetical protein